jgi:hypothetical protein
MPDTVDFKSGRLAHRRDHPLECIERDLVKRSVRAVRQSGLQGLALAA